MDFTKLFDTLKKGVEFAEELAPVLDTIPVAGSIVNTAVRAVGAITEVLSNVQEKVAEGAIVLHSDDQAQLTDLIDRITKANDELMAYVDNS
jgi:hypothetical protein